jgi:hypothetical protein
MKRIPVGARVRIADEKVLSEALRGPPERRPKPGQMTWASRDARVTGYRPGPGSAPLYKLRDAPGLWPEEWIDPV